MSKKTNDYKLIKKSMDLSMYWAERSKNNLDQIHTKLYLEIVQGGLFNDLREKIYNLLKHIEF